MLPSVSLWGCCWRAHRRCKDGGGGGQQRNKWRTEVSEKAAANPDDYYPADISDYSSDMDYWDGGVARLGQVGDYYYYYEDEYYTDRQSAGQQISVNSINPLAALIAPLAGLALMGAAAAVAVNPILLQLAVISNGRRKREVGDDTENAIQGGNDIKRRVKQLRVLEKFLSSMPGKFSQSDHLTSDYLRCSGLSEESDHCLEQLVCTYGQPPGSGALTGIERDVVSIILYNLMSNKMLSSSLKTRLRSAAKVGRDVGKCQDFVCSFGVE